MDQFSKYVNLYPIKSQDLDTIERVLLIRYFRHRGIPETILTDCGGFITFITRRWRDFARYHRFTVIRTFPYNPQSNPVERIMREIGRVLGVYNQGEHRRWDNIIPRLERTINDTYHSNVGHTPNEIERSFEDEVQIGGRRQRYQGIRVPRRLLPFRNRDIIVNGQRIIDNVRQNLDRSAERRKRQAEKRDCAKPYQTGQYVWTKIHRLSDRMK